MTNKIDSTCKALFTHYEREHQKNIDDIYLILKVLLRGLMQAISQKTITTAKNVQCSPLQSVGTDLNFDVSLNLPAIKYRRASTPGDAFISMIFDLGLEEKKKKPDGLHPS
jgi:hypothetical protein